MIDDKRWIRRRPVIRVFVSSTFSDLKHERDALQRDVFPRLEQFCASRQFQFQAIDLRWGVPSEASLDHRTMRICFEELRRSQEISPQPNFLILLGNRYGWRPLPEEICEDEFRRLEQAASSDADGQILRTWYRRDENAVPPVYLFRSRKHKLNDGRDYTNAQVWKEVQRVLRNVFNRAYPAAQLAGRFDHLAALDEPLPSIVRFQASATEQEIWRGALGAPNARQHVLAFVREIENIGEFPRAVEIRNFVDLDESGAMDADSQGALRELKNELWKRLGEDNLVTLEHARLIPTTNEKGEPSADVTTRHLDELCAQVYAAFKDIITRQMDEYWGTSNPTVVSPRELELECSEHQRFGQERAANFIGRDEKGGPLERIRDYLNNNSNQPLVIHGASGCGKTALLARAAEEVQKEEGRMQKSGQASQDSQPSTINHQLIYRFIGVSPRSSDVRSLLASLCQELRQRHPLESPIPGDVRELTKELNEHFKTATAQAPLILFLDALDQLADADNGPSLFWIPFGQLPANMKLIVSCLSDRATEDPAGQPYTALKRRGLADENFINLDALSEDEAQTLLFERWLPQARRKLNAEQAECIRERLKSDACRQPLYLKVLFEEARLWRSDDPAPTLGNNVSELLGTLFERLGDPSNHGPTLECALGYIAAARRGLTEMEILEVLYQDPDYAEFLKQMTARTGHQLPDNPKRIPIAIWSRLRFDLASYLTEQTAPGGTVLNFYHRQVAEFVRGQFLDTPLKRQTRHERLAGYFHGQDYFLESLEEQRARAKRLPPSPRPASVRKVDELPLQRLEAAKLSGEWEAVEELFTELLFLEAKAEADLVFDLARDFAEAVKSMPVERPKHRILKLLEEALRRDIHFIARHPTTLFQCLWNRCWWYDCAEAADHYQELSSKMEDAIVAPWNLSGPKLHVKMQDWLNAKNLVTPGFMWVRSIRPLPDPAGVSMKGTLAMHDRGVLGIAFSPDGERLASASADGTVKIWDTRSGCGKMCLLGHKSRVTSVAYFSDNIRIASASDDETIRVWDTTMGKSIACLNGHEGWILAVAVSPNGKQIASASSDGTVRLWNWLSGEHVCLGVHKPWARTVAFSPDGTWIASGGSDKTVRLWNAESRELLGTLTGHTGEVRELAFSPCGNRLASAGGITIRIWNLATRRQQIKLDGPAKTMCSVAWLPNEETICGGSEDGTVRLWDCRSGRELFRTPEDRHNWVMSVATSPYVDGIAAAYADGNVRLLDPSKRPERYRIICHRMPINGIGFFDRGSKFVSWSIEGGSLFPTVFIWDVNTGRFLGTAPGWSIMTRLETKNCRRVDATGGESEIQLIWGEPLGWVSTELSEISYNTDHRVWAGCYNKDVYMFKLEGEYDLRRADWLRKGILSVFRGH